MISFQSVSVVALLYLVLLFFIAYVGDSKKYQNKPLIPVNLVYALSLAVYCSSWTFYGAVGTAASSGFDYLAIYFGPFLVFVFGYPLIRRVIIICKQTNITSVSDFISSRFGKSRRIGVLVTVIAVVGSLPYIALQLKAVSITFTSLVSESDAESGGLSFASADIVALYTGLILATFAVLFGTRHLDSTEHHRGMVLAIAFESIVKLAAILAAGYYAVTLLFDNIDQERFSQIIATTSLIGDSPERQSNWISFLTKTMLAMGAIVLLPRQFQVTVVESFHHRQFKTAMWLMPIYLILTSIIVIPIALTGLTLIPDGEADLYVLGLPLLGESQFLSIFIFIGGLSAATGMVIVAVISLSTMVCNDLVMPNLIRSKSVDISKSENLDKLILLVRRLAIVGLIAGSFGYYKLANYNTNLANIGLIAFAAIFLFVPAFLCSLYWRRAHSEGIFWGLLAGFAIWGYTLLLPTILDAETIQAVWASNAWIHPQALFGVRFDNSLTHGVFWSTTVNLGLIVFFSLRKQQSVLEKLQASRFYTAGKGDRQGSIESPANRIPVHPDALKILAERIIGQENTEKLFQEYENRTGRLLRDETQVDRKLLALVQTAIVGVIGTPSAQKLISETILGGEEYLEEATTIVDDASTALQFNRTLLQTTLENITHGIAAVDKDLNLVIWNDRYLQIFDYPENFIYVGKPVKEVLEYNARRGDFQEKNPENEIRKRLKYLAKKNRYESVRTRASGVIVKSVGEPLPGGGFVTTYEDITKSVRASEQLKAANEELEDRVKERTRELEVITQELKRNTRSKTHFLAAASHDLLQPINAARLFTHSIQEKKEDGETVKLLANRVEQSLASANQLLRALLDISKLDAGGIKPESTDFPLTEFIEDISREFEPTADAKNVTLKTSVPEIRAFTDKQLLLSVLQNLVTNAIRYTDSGGSVCLSVVETEPKNTSSRSLAKISVTDDGIGIASQDLESIFGEFYRVKSSQNDDKSGLGLGLSIVDRISRLLQLNISVESALGQGSTFSIEVPISDALSDQTDLKASPVHETLDAGQLVDVKVLCIDNDMAVLDAMTNLLKGWGCDVVSVKSYGHAKEHLLRDDFQFVLADYRLDDEETGLDVLKLAAEQSDSGRFQGILITAEHDETLGGRVFDLGFHYLEKPVEPKELKTLLLCLVPGTEIADVS